MKNKLLLTLLGLCCALQGYTQIISSGSSFKAYSYTKSPQATKTSLKNEVSSENRLYISYDFTNFSDEEDMLGDITKWGVSAGYARTSYFNANKVCFVDYGLRFSSAYTGAYYEDNELALSEEITLFNISVPLNFGFNLKIGDNVNFVPYFGLGLKINVVGKYYLEYVGSSGFSSAQFSYDIFSEDDMGFGNAANRVQIVGQAGFLLYIKRFIIGVEYNRDITKLLNEERISKINLSVGHNF